MVEDGGLGGLRRARVVVRAHRVEKLGASGRVERVGPAEAARRVSMANDDPDVTGVYDFVALAPGGRQIGPFTVTADHVAHPVETFAYRFEYGGRTLAYYGNIATDTAIAPEIITYTDLTVDVLIRPDGDATVLDEDELPDDLAPPHRGVIAKAREALLVNPKRLAREIEALSAAANRS